MKVQAIVLMIQGLCPAGSRGCPAPELRSTIAAVIYEESKRTPIDSLVVTAVMRVESRFNPAALGSRGEVGLLQVLPSTAEELCPKERGNLRDIRNNVRCGLKVLARARRICGGGCAATWLGLYSGVKRCGPSKYGEAVVGMISK